MTSRKWIVLATGIPLSVEFPRKKDRKLILEYPSLYPPETQKKIESLSTAIETVIKGKGEAIRQCLVALFAGGHLLVEDAPGVGKTTIAHSLALAIACQFRRIQFTSDLLPSDIIGISVYNQRLQVFEFKAGPIFANVVLADEINRTTPKTQSALLEAMSEGQVTVDNQTYPLPKPFLVLATQNPIEHHGTYPLPESQLDRFLMRIRIGYPSLEAEKEIFQSQLHSHPIEHLQPHLTAKDVLQIQEAVKTVRVDEALVEYALRIVERTRHSEYLSLGASPRGSLSLLRAAQARAYVLGREYCLPDDIKVLVPSVLAHRVVVNSRFASTLRQNEEAEAILADILQAVEVPL
ncbi:MAG TPA: MoxR family ATPase [Terriglobia bacterium]|nr:MoxR family ATPase [Terriglobia bacterium]